MFTKTLMAALLLTASAAFAQQSPAPAPSAADVTREMTNRLHLNDGQYVQLLRINKVRLARQQEIEQATASNPAARTAQLAELQSQFEQECGRILSPAQLAQLQQGDAPAEGGNG